GDTSPVSVQSRCMVKYQSCPAGNCRACCFLSLAQVGDKPTQCPHLHGAASILIHSFAHRIEACHREVRVSLPCVALATVFEHFESGHTTVSGHALNGQNPLDYGLDLKERVD